MGRLRVRAETHSYLHTIAVGRMVVRHQNNWNWRHLSRRDYDILVGRDRDEGVWGLLGTMTGAGRVKRAFNHRRNGERDVVEIRNRIRAQLERVVAARDDDMVERVREAVRNIMEIRGFSYGSATRLLSLARPDRLVSVNNESSGLMGEYFGRPFEIRDPRKFANRYAEFLNWLYDMEWFKQEPSTSSDPVEQEIWNCRAALLDAYFYSGLNKRNRASPRTPLASRSTVAF